MGKSLIRPGMILLAFLAGALVPSASDYAWTIRYLLMVILFIMFLRVRVQKLRPRKTHWRLLAANILIALAAWYTLKLANGDDDIFTATAFFTGIIPTAAAAPVVIGFLGGSIEFAVMAFLISNLGIALCLVPLIPFITGQFTLSFIRLVALNLLFVIGIPLAAAFVLRKCVPSIQKLSEKCSSLSFFLWNVMLFLTAANASLYICITPGLSSGILLKIAGLSLILCIINFVTGFLVAERDCRQEASQSLGQKNTMLLIYITLTFAGPLPTLGPTFYVLWHNLWNAMQLFLHDRKLQQQEKRSGLKTN